MRPRAETVPLVVDPSAVVDLAAVADHCLGCLACPESADQIVARIELASMRVELAEAHLRRGDLVLDVSGEAGLQDGAWRTDLRASGRNMSISELIRHWPLPAAEGARAWVARNIRGGTTGPGVRQSDRSSKANCRGSAPRWTG